MQDDMPANGPELPPLLLPRVGAAIAGAALVFPWLTLPLVVACLAALGNLALAEAKAGNVVPEIPPAREPHAPRNAGAESDSTEDSFPASDPPSWTPVTGTGTRH